MHKILPDKSLMHLQFGEKKRNSYLDQLYLNKLSSPSYIQDGRVEGLALISVRTPELQLAAEQLSTGKCWIPPKKDTPCKGKGEAPTRWQKGQNHI